MRKTGDLRAKRTRRDKEEKETVQAEGGQRRGGGGEYEEKYVIRSYRHEITRGKRGQVDLSLIHI